MQLLFSSLRILLFDWLVFKISAHAFERKLQEHFKHAGRFARQKGLTAQNTPKRMPYVSIV